MKECIAKCQVRCLVMTTGELPGPARHAAPSLGARESVSCCRMRRDTRFARLQFVMIPMDEQKEKNMMQKSVREEAECVWALVSTEPQVCVASHNWAGRVTNRRQRTRRRKASGKRPSACWRSSRPSHRYVWRAMTGHGVCGPPQGAVEALCVRARTEEVLAAGKGRGKLVGGVC